MSYFDLPPITLVGCNCVQTAGPVSSPPPTAVKESSVSQKVANATALYLEGIRDGRVREAVEAYTGDRYTQHSTGVADGVEGFVDFFDPFVANNPEREIRVVRSIVEGSFVFLHVYQNINNGAAKWVTADMFDTDDNDKIIEHWDVIAPYSDASSLNGQTQVDGPCQVIEEERTEQNKAFVASFVDDVLVNHRGELIIDYVADTCIQHNQNLPDGVDALAAFMAGPGADMIYRNVFKIIGQGNFVMVYSQVFFGQELAVFDLFRVEDGKIVEHWDNSEPVPQGVQPNSGKF